MGRPKMTEKQKAAARAEREAKKAAALAGVSAAADRAEARSATVVAQEDEPEAETASDNSDYDEKALFLVHLPIIKALRTAMNTANSNLRLGYKRAKAEGKFSKADFDVAIAVETAENEARERGRIARALRIAKFMGSSLGAQLDMFLEPDRTPAVDIAAEEGERDALQNLAAKPKYDPSTEQFRKYMEAYHNVSERWIKEGMGTLHPEIVEDEIAKAAHKAEMDALKERDAKAFAEYDQEEAAPTSGVPLTRAQYKAQMEAQQKVGTKH